MAKPKVSVGLPVFNKEPYIRKAIDSLLNQTYSDFELIISDNASTDKSLSIIKEYNDPRIKLFTNRTNIGPTGNWNKCIQLAQGDLIALYHPDDTYESTMIEEQLNQFATHPDLGAVFTAGYIIDNKDEVKGELFLDEKLRDSELIDFNLAFSRYLESGKGSFICPTAMIPKTVYSSVGDYNGKDYRFAFDYDMYFRVLEKYPVKIITKKLIHYRIYPEQGTKQVIKKGYMPDEYFKIANNFIMSPALTRKIDPQVLKRTKIAEKKDYYLCAANALKADNIKMAFEWLDNAGKIYTGVFDLFIRSMAKSGLNMPLAEVIFKRYA